MKTGGPTVTPALPVKPVPSVTIISPESSSEATRERIAEVFATVELTDAVAGCRMEFELAEQRYGEFTKARDALTQHGKQLAEQWSAASQKAEEALLAQFARGHQTPVDTVVLDNMSRNRAESAAVSRTLERLAEHLLPNAFIAKLQTESRLLWARGAEIERIANERFARTAALMREAVEHEGAVTVNIPGTLSGQLTAYAAELRDKGLALSARADEEARKYLRLEAQVRAA